MANRNRLNRRLELAVVVVLLLLAAYLRFHLLGAQSFWNDEGNSYVQATRTFADIAANAGRDIHPPGYYWLLALWRLLTGDSEFALRAFSAFASVITVMFTYALGKRLYGRLAGVTAAALVALNTFSIYYAQEARMYALLALWAAAAMWVFLGFIGATAPSAVPRTWRGKQDNPARWALALALLNAAGLWTQYAYPFIMLAQGVLALLWFIASAPLAPARTRLRSLGLYIGANLLTIALYLPWLPTAWHQLTTWPNTGLPVPLSDSLSLILNWFSFGITYRSAASGLLAVVELFLLFGLLSLTPRRESRAWWWMLVPPVWMALPVGLFLALGMFREANVKLLLPAEIGLALWVGRGAWMLWRLGRYLKGRSMAGGAERGIPLPANARSLLPRLAAGAGLFSLAASLYAGLGPFYKDPAFRRADYRGLAAAISSDFRPGDAIILDAPNQEEVFSYYYQGSAPVYPLPAGLGGDDRATRAAVEEVISANQRIFAVFWGETERDPNAIVEKTLDDDTYQVDDTWYGDVRLARYVAPADLPITLAADAHFGDHITLERYALSADTVRPGDVIQIRFDWQTDAPLTTRYKVFLQLLNADGALVAQRDSEPGAGLALTTTWTPEVTVEDRHALLAPPDLPPGKYTLIAGLYDLNDPSARLPVKGATYLTLVTITIG